MGGGGRHSALHAQLHQQCRQFCLALLLPTSPARGYTVQVAVHSAALRSSGLCRRLLRLLATTPLCCCQLQACSAPLPCVARQSSRVVMHCSTTSSSGMLPSRPQQATSRDSTRRSRLEARHGCAAVPPPPLPSLPPLPPSSHLSSSSNHDGGSKKASSMTGRASRPRTPSAAPPSTSRAPRSCQRSWFIWGNSTIRPRAFSRSSLRHGSSGCQRQGSRRRSGGGYSLFCRGGVVPLHGPDHTLRQAIHQLCGEKQVPHC